MTIVIADNSPRKSYTATGGQTAFPTVFAFFDEADINVYINDTLQTLNTNYTVTGGSGSDGTVTLTTGASAGDVIVLTRDVELERTTDFPSSGPFQVGSLNTELDKIIAMVADMEDLAERGLRLSDSDTSASLVLADKDSRKGTVLAFNATTGAVEVGPTIADTQSIADIKADIAALADIEDGTVATDAISDLAAIASDVTTVAGVSSNVTTVAGQTTNMQNITDNLSAVQNAATNATTASTKATEAATSATNAATSETNAATSETNAATSETNASASATAASSSASAAATSATSAATSATSAQTAQTAAETAETNAETAETNASTSETNAASSATSAAASATTATTKASEASTSATNAATSATSAETAKTAAETAKTAAETAETNAETAETNAETAQTAAETAQTAAETAETNAAASASTATTKASEASTSATNAATSETNAATSATSAASSATSAATAQTAAESARDSALAAYDNFDDRYLGAKSSDPTVDNDGDALVAGSLYFNTTNQLMKIYTGSAWVAAYVSGTDFAALSGATFTGNVSFGDNNKAIFGAGSDLQIFHAGSNSYIEDAGTGDLIIKGADVKVISSDSENMAQFARNGAVTLYHDNSAKLATTSTGIDVTGTVTSDGLTVDGGVTNFGVVVTSTDQYAGIAFADNNTTNNATVAVYADGNHLGFEAGNAERFRADSSGRLLVGSTVSNGANAGTIVAGDAAATAGGVALQVRYAADDSLVNYGSQYSSGDALIGHGVASSQTTANTFISTADNAAFARGALTVGDELKFYNASGQTTTKGSAVTMTERLKVSSSGVLTVGGNTVWHAGNDGSGSGLHADLLDGYHAEGSSGNRWGIIPAVNTSGVMEIGRYIDFHASDGSTEDRRVRLDGGTAGHLYLDGHKVWHAGNDGSGSDLDADKIDGYHSTSLHRQIDTKNATVGGGWMTVASNGSGRYHGEVIVTDADSGDHAFIRIDWMRSYGDTNFTVLQCGGHGNRITGVRVLYETADSTYGTKLLQVYVTTSSNYRSQVYSQGSPYGFTNHTCVTPVIEDTKTGYGVWGDAITNLDAYSLATEEGIQAPKFRIGNGVTLNESSDRADLLEISSQTSGWGGLQIRNTASEGRWSFMTDGSQAGLYDDENGEWHVLMTENQNVALYYDGAEKFRTASNGITVTGNITGATDIYVDDQIISTGDTNTYLQFHAGDEFRIVTGGAERLEVNGNGVNIATYLNMSNDIDMNNNIIDDYAYIQARGDNRDVKLGVWNSNTYGIGMVSGVTYGYLNDYAMTHCMNNDSDRGFWWGYNGQSKSAGAMSLTTDGRLFVAKHVTVGTNQTSAAQPAIAIADANNQTSGFNTGMYSPTMNMADGLGFSVGGVEAVTIRRGFGNGWLAPGTDNNDNLGYSSRRWKQLYAGTTTISTSDENQKQQIATLTDAEIAAATAISKLFRTYKWNDAVEEKGDNARTHTGVIAQQVKQAMTDAGLDAANYAFFCSDTWWTDTVVVDPVEKVAAVYDDDGNMVTEGVDEVIGHTYEVDYFDEDEAPDSAVKHTMLGIRYPDLLSFVAAATEQRLANIETRLAALEDN